MFIRSLPISPGTGGGGGGGSFSDPYTPPSGTFTVIGDILAEVYKADDGTAGNPAYTFEADEQMGMYRVGTNQLGFATAGVVRLSITNATSINTTIPIYALSGTSADPSYSFTASNGMGMYRAGANQIGFSAGGSLSLTLNSTTSITATRPFYAPNGAVGGPAYAFTNNTTSGFYSIGTNNIGLALNGVLSLSTSPSAYTLTQAVATTGSPTAWTLTGAAHTTLTASTEATDVYYNLTRTVQFSTGAITTQRAFRIGVPTYGFVGSSTITTAYTFFIDGAPVVGTNAAITNSWAAGFGGNVSFLGSCLLATNQIYAFNSLTTGPAFFESSSVFEISAGPSSGQTMRLRAKQSAGTPAADFIMAAVNTRVSADVVLQVNNATSTLIFKIEAPNTTDNNSNLFFTWRKAGANSTERILVGANDTAGAGFKALCVPN